MTEIDNRINKRCEEELKLKDPRFAKIEAKREILKNASEVFYNQFINDLKNESPITDEEAKQWSEKYTTFDKAALRYRNHTIYKRNTFEQKKLASICETSL